MNKVILKGNCGNNPQVTNFDNGGKVAQFSLATTERYTDRNGEKHEKTDWHNIVVKRSGLAGVCEQYVKKGTPLLIVGKVQTRDYTDSYGNKRYVTEINVEEMELLGGKRDNSAAPAPAPEPTYTAQAQTQEPAEAPAPNPDGDDLPF